MAIEYLRPSTGSGTFTNPANAYDGTDAGDNNTYANLSAGDASYTWTGFPSAGQTYTALTLNVSWEFVGNQVDDTAYIWYSIDGGSNWNDVVASGVKSTTSKTTVPITLSAGQDLTLLQVQAHMEKNGGPDSGTDLRIWEIWTEGTYTAANPITKVISETVQAVESSLKFVVSVGSAIVKVLSNSISLIASRLTHAVMPVSITDTDPFGDGSCLATYPFDTNTNDLGGTHNATANGTLTYQTGKFNNGARSDAIADYIQYPTSLTNILEAGTVFSMSTWYSPVTASTFQYKYILSAEDTVGWTNRIRLMTYASYDTLAFHVKGSGGDTSTDIISGLSTTGLYHIGITVNLDGFARVYLDGDLVHEIDISTYNIDPTQFTQWRSLAWEGDTYVTNCLIDQTRFFDKELSGWEVMALSMERYNPLIKILNNTLQLARNLIRTDLLEVLYTDTDPFGDSSMISLYLCADGTDEVSSKNFTLTGPTQITGKFDKALAFDGTDYGTGPGGGNVWYPSSTSDLSMFAWVRIPDVAGTETILSEESTTGTETKLGLVNGRVYAAYLNTLSAWQSKLHSTAMPTDTWTFIGFRLSGGYIKTQMNTGYESAAAAGTTRASHPNMYLGKVNNSGGLEFYNGDVCQISIFNRDLTDAEAVKLYYTSAAALLIKLLSDVLQVSESKITKRGLLMLIASTVQAVSVLIRARAMKREILSLIQLSSVVIRYRVMSRMISSASQINEALQKLKSMVRVRDESESVSESLVRALYVGLIKVYSETVQIVGSYLRPRSMARQKDDVEQTTDSSLRSRIMSRVHSSTSQLVESVIKSRAMVRVRSAVSQLADSAIPAKVMTRIKNEDESIATATIKVLSLGLIKIYSDTVQFVESKIKSRGLLSIISDTLQFSEIKQMVESKVRMASMTVSIASSLVRTRTMARVHNATAGISEASLRIRSMVRSKAEELQVIGSKLIRRAIARIHSSVVQISEDPLKFIATGVTAIIRVIASVLQLTDGAQRRKDMVRSTAATMQLADSVAKFMGLVRAKLEQVSVQDLRIRVMAFVMMIAESMPVQSVVIRSRAMYRVLNEGINVADSVLKYLHATLIMVMSEGVSISESAFKLIWSNLAKVIRLLFAIKHPSVEFSLRTPGASFDMRVAGVEWTLVEGSVAFSLRTPSADFDMIGGSL